jgi:hypothetical protein
MGRAYQERFGLVRLPPGPPQWAVSAVKFCLVGMLMLPFTTALWLVACAIWPVATTEMAPVAFAATVLVAVSTFACVLFVIGRYPPVRSEPGPSRGGR